MAEKAIKELVLNLAIKGMANTVYASQPGVRATLTLLYELSKNYLEIDKSPPSIMKIEKAIAAIYKVLNEMQPHTLAPEDDLGAFIPDNIREKLKLIKFVEDNIDEPDAVLLIAAINKLRTDFKLNPMEKQRVDQCATVLGMDYGEVK